MIEAYIFDAVRTPRGKGKKDGSLHQATPVWLLRTLLQAAERAVVETKVLDEPVTVIVSPSLNLPVRRSASGSSLPEGWKPRVEGSPDSVAMIRSASIEFFEVRTSVVCFRPSGSLTWKLAAKGSSTTRNSRASNTPN